VYSNECNEASANIGFAFILGCGISLGEFYILSWVYILYITDEDAMHGLIESEKVHLHT
jgi:hypothetical protein